MRHAGARLKNLHNHPFIWNKHTIHFQPARRSRKHVSIYLGSSVHLALPSFGATRTHTSALQCASGQCWCEHAICTHTIRSTLAAVHTMPCLFITAWHMVMMLIDFIKASPAPPTPHHLTHSSSSPPSSSILLPDHNSFVTCKRPHVVIQNNGWWRAYTDHSADCVACAVERET